MVVTVNHTTEGLEAATSEALNIVDEWIIAHGLKLAHSKTEAVMLTVNWADRQTQLYSGGV